MILQLSPRNLKSGLKMRLTEEEKAEAEMPPSEVPNSGLMSAPGVVWKLNCTPVGSVPCWPLAEMSWSAVTCLKLPFSYPNQPLLYLKPQAFEH